MFTIDIQATFTGEKVRKPQACTRFYSLRKRASQQALLDHFARAGGGWRAESLPSSARLRGWPPYCCTSTPHGSCAVITTTTHNLGTVSRMAAASVLRVRADRLFIACTMWFCTLAEGAALHHADSTAPAGLPTWNHRYSAPFSAAAVHSVSHSSVAA